MPDLDKLKEHVHKLDQLLSDQQPGLITWCMFVGETWKSIAEMWKPTSGPPTPDLPAEPDSTPETPSEKLVPIWIRDYIREQIQLQIRPVWKTIKDLTDHFVGLASKVPPGSESALRGKWRVGSKVPLNVYDGDRPVCQCHSFMDALDIVNAMNGRKPQRIGVYDYDSLVACLTQNFQMVFFQHSETDPQDMIQLMAAEIQNLRRELAEAALRSHL